MRNCLIVANWKSNNNIHMIKKFFKEFKKSEKIYINTKCHIAIAPSTIYLQSIKKYITNYPKVTLAAQNVDLHSSGAFTGEISSEMLEELGVKYIIIGHSERRKYHKEKNEEIAKKFKIIKTKGMIPILCIGENKKEKNKEKTQLACAEQLNTILELFGSKIFTNTVIAYEPTWSIGTGITDTPKNIQKMHKFIRDYIANHDQLIAKQIIIQYGGSVTPNNIKDLLTQKDIDGVLVGTASLNATDFTSIIKIAENTKYHTQQ